MNSAARLFLFNSIAAALLLAGCAGGGGGETGTGAAPKVAVGTITNFGSVFVNGVEFFTSSDSVFVVDGVAVNEAALKIGMVVSVRGSVGTDGKTGSATHIEFADDAEGIVLSNTVINSVRTLDVMGRTVTVDTATVFESYDKTVFATVESILPGAVVEISGLSATGGDIVATRVELKKKEFVVGNGEIETKGIVTNLNVANKTFMLGGLTVDFSSVHVHDQNAQGLVNQRYVEVKSTKAIVGNKLFASSINAATDHKRINGKRGDTAKLEGVVTNIDVPRGQVTVNGQVVSGVSAAVLAELRAGQKLEVEGDFDDDGVLTQKKEIKRRESSSLEILAKVEATNASNNTITLLGQTFKVDAATLFKDDCGQCSIEVRQFSVNKLTNVDRVEIKARRLADGTWLITKLERTDPSTGPARIVGKVESVVGQVVIVGGISITLPDGETPPLLGSDFEREIASTGGRVTVTNHAPGAAGSEVGDD